MTQQTIIQAIDKCIAETESSRKKTVGLPRLRAEIQQIPAGDIRAMIGLLLTACAEPEPRGMNPPDNASKYWANRHSAWTVVTGWGKTKTRVRLDAIITEYRSHTTPAPPPREPVYLETGTTIDATKITRMKAASRRADGEIVLLGHGEQVVGEWFKVPLGTTVKFYTPPMAYLRGVDIRAIAAPEVWGRYERPKVHGTGRTGSYIEEYQIGELSPVGIGHTGPANQLGGTWMRLSARPRKLSTILKSQMGTVHFAACRCLPASDDNNPESRFYDVISFAAGEGRTEPGPEPSELSKAQIEVLARQGGLPTG